jgi:drug/metabolite transporter (DMT)-like permease
MTAFFNIIGAFKGEIFALVAAFLWALASLWFKTLGKTIRPLELNLLKGLLALLLFAVTSLLIGESYLSLPLISLIVLAVSGAVGIGLGDTMFFAAINRLGSSRALLLTVLAPPMAALLGWAFMNEKLSLAAWAGILITILGVTWVISGQSRDENGQPHRLQWSGLFFGFMAAFGQATGAVLSRWALAQGGISALQTAVLRLIAGTLVLLLWSALRHEKIGTWIKPGPIHVCGANWLLLCSWVLIQPSGCSNYLFNSRRWE